MAIAITDIEGRHMDLMGASGIAGTSINLNVVAVTQIFSVAGYSGQQRWLPMVIFLTRFSTGSGAVPGATITVGGLSATTPNDWLTSTVLSGNGPTLAFVTNVPNTVVSYSDAASTKFYLAVTAGAVGTCDVVVYGVLDIPI